MQAYCLELRERIVAFIDEGNLFKDAVETFKVSYSSIHRLMLQREEAGDLSAKPHGGGNPGRFKPEDLALLTQLNEEHPDSYLWELAEMLSKAGGPTVHPSTIYNRLKELGVTRKKKELRAAEQDTAEVQEKRDQFRRMIATIDPRKLVFLDESGVNLGMTRHFARSLHGTRARASAPINVGPNVSIAAAIRLEVGIIAAMTVDGAYDGEAFLTFVKEILVPALQSGDHVVMDNLGAHRMAGVIEAVEAVGAHVLRLPPYSPDFNPIEKFWSTFKEWLRSVAARTNETLQDAIANGMALATSPRTLGWFKESGYFQCKLKPL